VIARQKALNDALADDETTPLAIVGGLFLWLLRLALAPRSTLSGFRRWVLAECPVAPGRRAMQPLAAPALSTALPATPSVRAISPRARATDPASGPRGGTKTSRFLGLVAERHGPLAELPIEHVSRICTALAPEIGLDPGAARAALRKHLISLQAGKAES
jgi:hypothetical protein